MSLILNYDIEELPDAESFILYDLTGNYITSNLGGWGTPNTEENVVVTFKLVFTKISDGIVADTLTLTAAAYPVTDWVNGVLIPFTDGTILADGSYTVDLTTYDVSGVVLDTQSLEFCFYALIKDEVMNDLLSYNTCLPKQTKELYLEKGRILDNLYYAAQESQVTHFNENLANLVKLT